MPVNLVRALFLSVREGLDIWWLPQLSLKEIGIGQLHHNSRRSPLWLIESPFSQFLGAQPPRLRILRHHRGRPRRRLTGEKNKRKCFYHFVDLRSLLVRLSTRAWWGTTSSTGKCFGGAIPGLSRFFNIDYFFWISWLFRCAPPTETQNAHIKMQVEIGFKRQIPEIFNNNIVSLSPIRSPQELDEVRERMSREGVMQGGYDEFTMPYILHDMHLLRQRGAASLGGAVFGNH